MFTKRSVIATILGNFWLLFGSIWLTVGLPFLMVAGYLIIQERQLSTRGRLVEAMVLTKDISRSSNSSSEQRSVTYRFATEDGRTIQGRSDVSQAIWDSLTERGAVSVMFLPDRPSVNHVVGASKLPLLAIFASVGGLVSIVGGTLVFVALRTERMKQRLRTSGVEAQGVVAEVAPMNLRVNGRTQWRLKYDYQDSQGRSHRCSIHLVAEEAQRWQPGDAGAVLFDPQRPEQAMWLGRPEESAP